MDRDRDIGNIAGQSTAGFGQLHNPNTVTEHKGTNDTEDPRAILSLECPKPTVVPYENVAATFYPFPELPLELQQLIWELALPEGQHVSLDWEGTYGLVYDLTRGFDVMEPLPATLHASHESRRITLIYYTVILKTDFPYYRFPKGVCAVKPFCYNPDRDSLCVSILTLNHINSSGRRNFSALMDLLDKGIPKGGLNRIKSLEVRDMSFYRTNGSELFTERHRKKPEPAIRLEKLRGLERVCCTQRDRDSEDGKVMWMLFLHNEQKEAKKWIEKHGGGFLSGKAPDIDIRRWQWFDPEPDNWVWKDGSA